tara:strand:- start:466 stop:873 length:408 start_codon:yes stop_codon:yes gene_type:complete
LKYYRFKGADIHASSYLGPNVYIDVNHPPGKIKIGKNCYITRNSSLLAHSDAFMGGPQAKFVKFGGIREFGDIVIEDNVFIGFHSVILPGVKIGKNSVIGAMSLVNKDIPENSIAAGVPVKIIGNINDKLDKYDG